MAMMPEGEEGDPRGGGRAGPVAGPKTGTPGADSMVQKDSQWSKQAKQMRSA